MQSILYVMYASVCMYVLCITLFIYFKQLLLEFQHICVSTIAYTCKKMQIKTLTAYVESIAIKDHHLLSVLANVVLYGEQFYEMFLM